MTENFSQLQLKRSLENSMFNFPVYTKQTATQILSYVFLNTTNIL